MHVYVPAEIYAMLQFMDSLSSCLHEGYNASVHVFKMYGHLSLMCVCGGGGGQEHAVIAEVSNGYHMVINLA